MSRASRFLFARRSTVPRTRRVRPSSNGRGRRSCIRTASSAAADAPVRSPRAASTSARHLAPVATVQARSRFLPASSKGARSASASSSRPRATSASTSSGTTRKYAGSRTPIARSSSRALDRNASASAGRPRESSRNPRTDRFGIRRKISPAASATRIPSRASSLAESARPRWASTRPTAKWPSDDMGPMWIRWAAALLSRACSMAASQLPARHSSSARWYRICASGVSTPCAAASPRSSVNVRRASSRRSVNLRSCATTKLARRTWDLNSPSMCPSRAIPRSSSS